MKNLDWDDLRVFLEAARVSSVTKAAKALAINHSTVSRRLTRLEYAVGGALFEGSRDGLRLTQTGMLVLCRAEEVAGGIGSLGGDLTEGGNAGGAVRLATMEGIASLYLASRAGSLRDARPRLRLELVTSPQTVRITRREADLFLSFFRPPGRGLACERIGSFSTGIHASPAYLEARGGRRPRRTGSRGMCASATSRTWCRSTRSAGLRNWCPCPRSPSRRTA